MYIPTSFRIDDPDKLQAFIDSYSFATLVTLNGPEPFASHLPIRNYHENGECTTLTAHMARANPQWRHFSADADVLAIFTGPHAYISPSWYSTVPSVPTWNYAAVHVYGRPVVMDDPDQVVSLLAETVAFYENAFDRPWPGILPDEFRDRLIESIVAFEIRVTRIEGKFKLGQNRSATDVENVFNELSGCGDPISRQLADLMVSQQIVDRRESASE